MKKLAVFVEGQTEQIFFQRLIVEMAGAHKVSLSIQSRSTDKIVNLKGESSVDSQVEYFVLIYDCQCDSSVKSKIIENHAGLVKAGYSTIFGLLDLYPRPLSDLPRVRQALPKYVPTAGVAPRIHLAIAEVEAWFLQEETHYVRIHPLLTREKVVEVSGFDPAADSAESIAHPAGTLKQIYNSVGLGYAKSKAHVQRTVNALDMDSMCLQSSALIPSFSALYLDVEAFLTEGAGPL